jgi:DNA-binding CsgD family transcriptional regulator
VHDLERCQEFFLSKVKALVPFDFWLSGIAYNTECVVDKIININENQLALCDSQSHQSWFKMFRLLVEQSTINLAPIVSHVAKISDISKLQHTNITIRQCYSNEIFQIVAIDPKARFSTYHCVGLPAPHMKRHYQQVLGEIVPFLQSAFYQSLLNHFRPSRVHNLLTVREQEVLNFMALGNSNPEIANRLGISTCTVKNQVHSILQKLDVSNRMQAITKALALGIIKSHH